MTKPNPYKALLKAGCEMDSHESDLYVRATPEAVAIVKESGWRYETFTSQTDGQQWLDLAFAYEPFWESKQRLTGTHRLPSKLRHA
jgi:hypothetical protein